MITKRHKTSVTEFLLGMPEKIHLQDIDRYKPDLILHNMVVTVCKIETYLTQK